MYIALFELSSYTSNVSLMVLFASGKTLQLSRFNMYICDITIEDRKRIYLTRSELTFVLESLALDFTYT